MNDLRTDLASLKLERDARGGSSGGLRWAALALLLLVSGAVWWYWQRPSVVTVTTTPVVARGAGGAAADAAVLNASGYVTARRRATVSSRITGKVVSVDVEEGMSVTQGQVLARLDDSTARAMLQLAEAQLGAARAQFSRPRCASARPTSPSAGSSASHRKASWRRPISIPRPRSAMP